MEYGIFEKITSSASMQKDFENGIKNRLLSYREQLEQYYTFDKLPGFNVSRAQAIAINLHNRQAIDEFYFTNITRFSKMAYGYARNDKNKTLKNCVEDMTQQIYVDCRYYDFSSEKTLVKDIFSTCSAVFYGGILAVRARRKDKQIYKSIDETISLHNSKMEDGTSLLDFLSAPDELFNPETLYIKKEEENDLQKQYKEEMLYRVAQALPESKREKFFNEIRGGND